MSQPPNGNPPKPSLADALKAARENKPEYIPYPEGDYLGIFTGFVPSLNSKDKEQIESTLTFTASDDPTLVDKTIKDWLQLEGNGLFKLAQILEVLGLDVNLIQKKTDIARILSGMEIGLTIQHKTDQFGVKRAKIKRYWDANTEKQRATVAQLNASIANAEPQAQTAAPPAPPAPPVSPAPPVPTPPPTPPPPEPGPPPATIPNEIAERKQQSAKTVSSLRARIEAQTRR
jgi:hypothetical protein